MTEVSKASAYPKSVQPGLPRLGITPLGWSRGPLSEHLIEQVRPVKMADHETYDLVTVKRSRGGVVLRERLKGNEIAVKSQFRLKAGDFLISKRQIVHGACGIVPPELDGAIVSNEYSVLRAHPSLDLRFLNCLAHSIYFQQTCFHSSIGVHIEKMIFKLEEWLKWDFDLPPAREQRRIAEILATWDQAIETVDALIANARAQKRALMQHLFPQGAVPPRKHLPGSSGEWEEARLGSLAYISKGEQKGRAGLADKGPVPVINGGIAPSGYTDQPNTAANTITISEGGNSCGHVDLITQPFWCGGHCYALTNLKVDRDFLFATLKHRQLEIMALRVGSGLPNIQKKALSQFTVTVPSASEQVKIGEIASTAYREVVANEVQLTALLQEKAALMQQLLTGKLRVKLAESELS